MDIDTFRSVMIVVLMVLFVGLVVWAYGRGRREDFDAAAQLPLGDDDKPPPRDERKEDA